MVPNLTNFVFLACACVAINAALAPSYEVPLSRACMMIRDGSTAGFKSFVQPIILPQGQVDWKMPLPQCQGETGGADVIACDDDKIPSVKIVEPSILVVHRTGNLKSYSVVQITLYCLSPEEQ